jgi:hypothetical protein
MRPTVQQLEVRFFQWSPKITNFTCRVRIGTVETVYYFFSFGFLMARTVAVTLYGAWINDESKKPLQILHSVPSEHYCGEVK